MSDNVTGVLIVLVCVLGPIWLTMHYRYKMRTAGSMSAADASTLDQALLVAQRLEQRVIALEQILDADVPAWRGPAGRGQAGSGTAYLAGDYRRQAG